MTLRQITRDARAKAIVDALRRSGGNVTDAARLLGLRRQNLYPAMRALGIQR